MASHSGERQGLSTQKFKEQFFVKQIDKQTDRQTHGRTDVWMDR